MRLLKAAIGILSVGMLVLLAYATFVEQAQGTDYAHTHIYGTLWFCLWWAAIALLGTTYYIYNKVNAPLHVTRHLSHVTRHLSPVTLLHLSFLIILAGAAVTHFTGKEGILHLRAATPTNQFYNTGSNQPETMPITIELESFHIDYHPGTQAPADFISRISYTDGNTDSRQQAAISMNHILATHGYRFYQSSFDADHQGTLLSVNYDPWGTRITYFGYALLGISMVFMLLSRRGEFRRLLRHPALRTTTVLLLLLTCHPSPAISKEKRSIPTVNREKAAVMARQQVVYNDRIAPFSTLAHDFLQKIYGKSSYKGLTAEQVTVGWSLRPEAWKNEPMILVKDGDLRQQLGISGKYARLSDLFDADGQYKLASLPSPVTRHMSPVTRHPSQNKSLRELDEKVGLILMLTNGELIKPVPDGVQRLSDTRVSAEILYNTLPMTKILFMVNLTMGFLLFFLLMTGRLRRFLQPAWWLLALSFTALLLTYALRWYIAGRIPLANGFETMLFLSLCIMLAALLITRSSRFTPLTSGFLLSGFTLLVSHLGQMNPQITPLMPVLQSPLLSAHVSLIMMAYALLAMIALNGIYALLLTRHMSTVNCKPSTVNRQPSPLTYHTLLTRILLYPAVFLLGIGIFLGAVWANVSWGHYWSWDPKEVWALITFIIYGAAFHRRSLPFLRHDRWFHLYMVLAFLTVLMTYFGVNYFLGGMHSYA